MKAFENVLVIGSGIAGMDACLMLSKAGKKVYLVEKLPITGGKVIKNEESFPNLDCSTCLVAPIQQEILQDPKIEVLTLSTVEKVTGEPGNLTVTINKKARYVSIEACLGCGMCYPVCPVDLKNEWEENLMGKKAIYVPCSGSLPNVPCIDSSQCLQLSGKESCSKCVEACMFAAIDMTEKDEKLEVNVGGIIVATGFDSYNVSEMKNLGYGKFPGVYTAFEFERLFASNGPTEGKLVLRNSEKVPESIAIVHCVGREKVGYCSNVCCMSSSKHAHFLKHKLPEAKVYNLYSDICVIDKTYQKFYANVKSHTSEFIFLADREKMNIKEANGKLKITYLNNKNKEDSLVVDMVILESALAPSEGVEELAKSLEIDRDPYGFIAAQSFRLGSVATSRPGIFVAGCAEGPKDIQNSVIQSEAAVAGILSMLKT